jgi:DNA-binding transcriptional regulator YiaG
MGAVMPDRSDENEEVRRVLETVDSLEAVEDPAERARRAGRLLAEWPEQHTRIREIRQAAVLAMREQEISYRKIAAVLEISVARVQQIEAGERGRASRKTGDKP